jgi:mRNA-degrading endonuclease YafQ of YafQ-DinJ toxin-antitoxin module
MDLFVTDQHHPLLQVHTLHGDRHPYVSFNVNADYRVILLYEGDGVTLYEIGTHSELYG